MANEIHALIHIDIYLDQNFNTNKNIAIMSMIEKIIKTRAWKEVRGLTENS